MFKNQYNKLVTLNSNIWSQRIKFTIKKYPHGKLTSVVSAFLSAWDWFTLSLFFTCQEHVLTAFCVTWFFRLHSEAVCQWNRPSTLGQLCPSCQNTHVKSTFRTFPSNLIPALGCLSEWLFKTDMINTWSLWIFQIIVVQSGGNWFCMCWSERFKHSNNKTDSYPNFPWKKC